MNAQQKAIAYLEELVEVYKLATKLMGRANSELTKLGQGSAALKLNLSAGKGAKVYGTSVSDLRDLDRTVKVLVQKFANTHHNLSLTLRDVRRDRGFMTGVVDLQLLDLMPDRLEKDADTIAEVMAYLEAIGVPSTSVLMAVVHSTQIGFRDAEDTPTEVTSTEIKAEVDSDELHRRKTWWTKRFNDRQGLENALKAARNKANELKAIDEVMRNYRSGENVASRIGIHSYEDYVHQIDDFLEKLFDVGVAARKHWEGNEFDWQSEVVDSWEYIETYTGRMAKALKGDFIRRAGDARRDKASWSDPQDSTADVENVEVYLRGLVKDMITFEDLLREANKYAGTLGDSARLWGARL